MLKKIRITSIRRSDALFLIVERHHGYVAENGNALDTMLPNDGSMKKLA